MRKSQSKRPSRPVNPKEKPRPLLREVTVDDVIKDLLDLFSHLGIDAGRLAARVVDLDPVALASRQLYPHASAIGELLTAWHQDLKYLDERGYPSPIKMRAGRNSFRRLAEKTPKPSYRSSDESGLLRSMPMDIFVCICAPYRCTRTSN
jgi:hypothetical protein